MIATFIGHRTIQNNDILSEKLKTTILELIDDKKVDTFLFGSRSAFDDLCLETVTEIKRIRPHIKRVYVRAAYPYIDNGYETYLLGFYDLTYIPDKIERAGKAAYVERNEYMIDRADVCIFYYDINYLPPIKPASGRRVFSYRSKSGTKIAYDYALKKRKQIINLYS